jgi:hypothetical protein
MDSNVDFYVDEIERLKEENRTLAKDNQVSNFTDVLRATFLYESALRSFSLVTVWLCNILAKEYWQKSCS